MKRIYIFTGICVTSGLICLVLGMELRSKTTAVYIDNLLGERSNLNDLLMKDAAHGTDAIKAYGSYGEICCQLESAKIYRGSLNLKYEAFRSFGMAAVLSDRLGDGASRDSFLEKALVAKPQNIRIPNDEKIKILDLFQAQTKTGT
jgi:hypothetical protein